MATVFGCESKDAGSNPVDGGCVYMEAKYKNACLMLFDVIALVIATCGV